MRRRITVLLLLALLVVPALTRAQPGNGYELARSTLDSGGTSTGGAYTMSNAIGQPATATLSGGDYTLTAGFWGSAGPAAPDWPYRVYLPIIVQ